MTGRAAGTNRAAGHGSWQPMGKGNRLVAFIWDLARGTDNRSVVFGRDWAQSMDQ